MRFTAYRSAPALVLTLSLGFTLAASQTAHADNDWLWRPHVPANLEVPGGHRLFLAGHAIGTQNYICAATPTGLKWVFIGPQATLFNGDFRQTFTHFHSTNPYQHAIQATWQHSGDSSAVWARRRDGSTDPRFVAPTAIEWLILEMTGTREGPSGGDRLTPTTFIQRVNTVGGKEPAVACTEALLNQRELVPYEADYYFYRAPGTH